MWYSCYTTWHRRGDRIVLQDLQPRGHREAYKNAKIIKTQMGLLDFLQKKKETEISSILPHEIYEAGALELKDIIAPSALKVTPKEINLGEKVLRSFFVISYPRFLSEGWFAPIINLDKIFDVAIFISPI